MFSSKKGIVMKLILGVIVMLILIVIFANIFSNGFKRTQHSVDTYTSDLIGVVPEDVYVHNELLREPVPDEFRDYAYELLKELFEKTTYTAKSKGNLYFISPFKGLYDENGDSQYSKYNQFSLFFLSINGDERNLFVGIHNSNTGEILDLKVHKSEFDFMKDKELCFISGEDSSTDILDVITHVGVETLKDKDDSIAYVAQLSPEELISKHSLKTSRLVFDRSLKWRLDAKPRFFLRKGSTNYELYDYWDYLQPGATSHKKIPIYVYENTVCFLETESSTFSSGSLFSDTIYHPDSFRTRDTLVGNGPLGNDAIRLLIKIYESNEVKK